MAFELFYTSVPKGLKPGTTGFCTVALTGGMPAPMIQKLESLSGYLPVYRLGTPNASKNPPSFAHWRPNIGGRYYSVMSYVCFAGADYSGRSNKFAHHVVLESSEQASCGPACAMMQPGVMERQWSGESRTLTPGSKRVPDAPNPPKVCSGWQQAAGDAGWAGVLADAFLLDASKPAYILYEPGMDVLPLINEAIALLDERVRWRVTFNTYFTTQPAGLSCSWRCCVAGTNAAQAAPANATSGVLIDLTGEPGRARDSKYATLARTGDGGPPTTAKPDAGDGMVTATARRPQAVRPGTPIGTGMAQDLEELLPEPDAPTATDVRRGVQSVPDDPYAAEHARPRSKVLLPLVGVVCTVLGLMIGVLVMQGTTVKEIPVADGAAEYKDLIKDLEDELKASRTLVGKREKRIEDLEDEIDGLKKEEARDARDNAKKAADRSEKPMSADPTEKQPAAPVKKAAEPEKAKKPTKSGPKGPPPLREVALSEAEGTLVADDTPELKKDAMGRVKRERIMFVGVNVDGATRVEIDFPVQGKHMKPFVYQQEGDKAFIHYSEAGRLGKKDVIPVAVAGTEGSRLYWEWLYTDRPVKKERTLNDLIPYSGLVVHDKDNKPRKVQFQKVSECPLKKSADLDHLPKLPEGIELALSWVDASGWEPVGRARGDKVEIKSNRTGSETGFEIKVK